MYIYFVMLFTFVCTIRLQMGRIKKTDSGIYSCRSELGKWYNLTLTVISTDILDGKYLY